MVPLRTPDFRRSSANTRHTSVNWAVHFYTLLVKSCAAAPTVIGADLEPKARPTAPQRRRVFLCSNRNPPHQYFRTIGHGGARRAFFNVG